jgi:recombination protein RecR
VSTPPSLVHLVEALERLPGIGRRSAERLAGHLLRVPETRALELADAIREARARIRACSRCRAPAEQDPCPICSDATRDPKLLVVVETPRDLAVLESSGGYRGLYYVLGGRLSPLDGVGANELDLDGLLARILEGDVLEVCLATNPDLEGDGTALLVERELARLARARARASGRDLCVTRLARGLPSGGQIEYQSAAVIAEALEGRRAVSPPSDGGAS